MARDPGSRLGTARAIAIAETPRRFNDTLDRRDSTDIWKFQTQRRSTLNLTLSGMSPKGNADVLLLNDRGQTIQFSRKPGRTPERLTDVLLESGTYYVKVVRRGRQKTRYSLQLAANPTADQFGDTFETATQLRSDTGGISDFVGAGDPGDFLTFSSLVAGRLKVNLTNLSDDANLEVYDSKRSLLFSSNNPGTANESIDQVLTSVAGSTYFIRVVPAAGKNVNYTLDYSVKAVPFTRTASTLEYADLVEGTGKMPSPKDRVTVQYTGILTNGFKFDSSRDRNSPFSFVIGDTPRRVIPGWEEGISTMKVGGRRQLVIPSRLAYGDEGIQNRDGSFLIPPGATLIFDVELLSSVPSTTA